MDDDLESLSREQLITEVKRLRAGIREHRDSSGHSLCWHHPKLWGLLPEPSYRQLGLPSFLARMATAAAILLWKRELPWPLVRAVSWGVLPLVAGLFVLVESLERTGAVAQLSGLLERVAQGSVSAGGWTAGVGLGLLSNLFNSLPGGLLAGSALQSAHLPPSVTAAALVGVDLGPNLSVTGSLATILWLTALRREGIGVSSWRFLKLGALVMPAALVLAVGALLLW
jgi:arsenical pump membrane protein